MFNTKTTFQTKDLNEIKALQTIKDELNHLSKDKDVSKAI